MIKIDQKSVRALSKKKEEPLWMLKKRLTGLRYYQSLALPNFGPDLSELEKADIDDYAPVKTSPLSAPKSTWQELDQNLRAQFEQLGIPQFEQKSLLGLGAQYDSEVVYRKLRNELSSQGVIFENMEEATKKHPALVRKYFTQLVRADNNKFAALNEALWSGGFFLWVPPNVNVEIPLEAYFYFAATHAGQFEHTVMVISAGASVKFIEACAAPRRKKANLHAGVVEIWLEKNARLDYLTVQNWSLNTYSLTTKAVHLASAAELNWASVALGTKAEMLYPNIHLAGKGARCKYQALSVACDGQDLDTGIRINLDAEKTKAVIRAKSIATKNARNTFRGLVKANKTATHSRVFSDCETLTLESGAYAASLPKFTLHCKSAEALHEAKVGSIDKDVLAFLASRGLSEEEAQNLVTLGFSSDILAAFDGEYLAELKSAIRLKLASQNRLSKKMAVA